MRKSSHSTVPTPRRPTRLLQRLLQSSGWRWRWRRTLLGQQKGAPFVPGTQYRHQNALSTYCWGRFLFLVRGFSRRNQLSSCLGSIPSVQNPAFRSKYVKVFHCSIWKETKAIGSDGYSRVGRRTRMRYGVAVMNLACTK